MFQFNPMGGPGQYNGGVVGVPTSQYGAGGSQYNAVPAYNQPAQAVAPMQPVAPMQSFQPPKVGRGENGGEEGREAGGLNGSFP